MQTSIEFSADILFDVPGIWGIKNQKLEFVYLSRAFADLFGIKNREYFYGCKDQDLPCQAAKAAATFMAQDKQVILGKKKLLILDVHPYANDQ